MLYGCVRIASTREPAAMPDDLAALRQQLAQLQATVDQIAHDQQIQFTRIAQIQADLDLVRGAWNQLTAAPDVPYTGPDRRKREARKTR
jgi:hypothetical protein